jgi:hypothetical protein
VAEIPFPAGACCGFHNVHCEPPADLCCRACTEAGHPQHPPGVSCVLADRCPRCREPLYSPAETDAHNRLHHNVGPTATTSWGAEP